jgi:hypothetical protein
MPSKHPDYMREYAKNYYAEHREKMLQQSKDAQKIGIELVSYLVKQM